MNDAQSTNRKGTLAAVCAGLFALGLTAQAAAQGAPAFADVDVNVDGVISEDEFLAAMPSMTSGDFATADLNADTVVTEDEYTALVDSM